MRHIPLRIEGAPDEGTQPVEVEVAGANTYQVLATPTLVEGLAAGDTIRILDSQRGHFEVVERGGYVAVKWGSPDQDIGEAVGPAEALLAALGARQDGASRAVVVWSIPASAGFPAIESAMERVVALLPGSKWWYGNVYGNDGEPLSWW